MIVKPGKLIVIDPQGDMQVLLDGVEVQDVKKLRILSAGETKKVQLTLNGHPMASALRAAGVQVKEV